MVYKVKNMSCSHCLSRIQTALKNSNVTASVDLATKTVNSDDTRVPGILKNIGYEVE
ncbi:MAG: heavy-metal-associated domain-containing protein [Bacilli bacterium]|jgi:copper chaperone CopZ